MITCNDTDISSHLGLEICHKVMTVPDSVYYTSYTCTGCI